MYKQTNEGLPMPTANLAVNKSRIKVYSKNSNMPVYYLQKGQEFQIELFNPTRDTILAKISLNGKAIAQGGLVLKPAQRVFLDRYIDVARKFKFDTYEVANTAESRAAIEENGDFKVEFYKESIPAPKPHNPVWINTYDSGGIYGSNVNTYYNSSRGISGQSLGLTSLNSDMVNGTTNTASLSDVVSDTLNFMDVDQERSFNPLRSKKTLKSKKSIETGRVEMGSRSDQTLKTVYMNWEQYPFHTIEYKMLPESQKVNTVADITVKRYCTNCGTKNKPNFKFCPSCGAKV